MADKPNRKKLIPKPPQKPNYQAYIIIALLVLIFGVLWLSRSSSTVPTTHRQFEQMMKAGDVKKVLLIANQDLVEITLTHEALKEGSASESTGGT